MKDLQLEKALEQVYDRGLEQELSAEYKAVAEAHNAVMEALATLRSAKEALVHAAAQIPS